MRAESAGSGGTVGLNGAGWLWAGEELGSGWAQPLGRAPTAKVWGDAFQTLCSIAGESFRDLLGGI